MPSTHIAHALLFLSLLIFPAPRTLVAHPGPTLIFEAGADKASLSKVVVPELNLPKASLAVALPLLKQALAHHQLELSVTADEEVADQAIQIRTRKLPFLETLTVLAQLTQSHCQVSKTGILFSKNLPHTRRVSQTYHFSPADWQRFQAIPNARSVNAPHSTHPPTLSPRDLFRRCGLSFSGGSTANYDAAAKTLTLTASPFVQARAREIILSIQPTAQLEHALRTTVIRNVTLENARADQVVDILRHHLPETSILLAISKSSQERPITLSANTLSAVELLAQLHRDVGWRHELAAHDVIIIRDGPLSHSETRHALIPLDRETTERLAQVPDLMAAFSAQGLSSPAGAKLHLAADIPALVVTHTREAIRHLRKLLTEAP